MMTINCSLFLFLSPLSLLSLSLPLLHTQLFKKLIYSNFQLIIDLNEIMN